MSAIDFNYLAFIWLGAFFLVNISLALILIVCAKKKRAIFDVSLPIVSFGFVILALISSLFVKEWGMVSPIEFGCLLAFVLVWFFMSVFVPDFVQNKKGMLALLAIAMAVSFLLVLFGNTDFDRLNISISILFPLAFLVWAWFIFAFDESIQMPEFALSEATFVAFAVLIGAIFLAFLGSEDMSIVGIIAGSLAIVLAGLKNWGKSAAWPSISRGSIIIVAFVLGWCLMKIAMYGVWAFAIIVPLYLFMESTVVAVKKYLLKRKKVSFLLVQKIQEGAAQILLMRFVFRCNLVFLMLALLAISDLKIEYLVVLSLLFVVYDWYRIAYWTDIQPTITGVTTGMFSQLNHNIKEQKGFYTKLIDNIKKKKTFKEALVQTNKEITKEAIQKKEPKKKVAMVKKSKKAKKN